MTAGPLFHSALSLLLIGVAGLALGLLHFNLLRRTIDALDAGWRRPALFGLARIIGTLLLFGLVSRLGGPALLAAFAGFLAARSLALRRARRIL
jgi:hypothetical protein